MAEYNPSKIIKDGNTYNFRDDTKIPLAGSSQISGSLIPSTDGTVNLGGSSYQWNNAYIKSLTINGVACGDILTHNASEFVDVTSAQTIGGVKTFSDGDKTFNDSAPLRIQGYNYGNEFSSNARTVLELRSNRDTVNKSCIYISKFRQNRAQGSMGGNDNVILMIDVLENEVRTNDLLRFTAHNWINDAPTEVYLEPATKASNIQSFLGSSTRPWGNTTTNAINGLNPGALSLPNLCNEIDISGYIDISRLSEYTAPADGYISISGYASGTNAICIKDKNYNFAMASRAVGATQGSTTYLIIPVAKNHVYEITCSAVSTLSYAKFYPCQGNV